MSTKPKYYIVESSALPEVFLKVAEAKRLLSTGEASTVNEATRMTDISRSAFYKYRDAVLPFQSMMTGRIITFQLLLHDEQGLLSEILGVFADAGANISTINSIVPTNGTAVVTISAETIDLTMTLEELMERLQEQRFIRIHKSYIVNFDYIGEFCRQMVVLRDGTQLPVSRTYRAAVSEVMHKLLKESGVRLDEDEHEKSAA